MIGSKRPPCSNFSHLRVNQVLPSPHDSTKHRGCLDPSSSDCHLATHSLEIAGLALRIPHCALETDEEVMQHLQLSNMTVLGGTWRIIPVSKCLVIMVNKSHNWGCSPSQIAFPWLINEGDPNHLQVLG